MRNLRHVGTVVLGLALVFGAYATGAARASAEQDQAPAPAPGRGRGVVGAPRGGIVGGPAAPGGRGAGRAAAAPLDPGGVTRRRLDLDTVIFSDAKGMTLYTYQKDTPGQSACSGPCATNWPPLAAAADATPSGDWTILTRADGTRQWAHQGRPLYTFVKDTKPGERAGEGAGGGAWRAASPIVPYAPRGK